MIYAFLWETVNSDSEILGVRIVWSPSTTYTGSTSKGTWQYSEKPQTSVSKQTMALGLLKAVTSMNTFLVSIDILETSELIIGGTEQTLLSQSKISG